MDYNTICSVLYEGQFQLAMRFKSRECQVRQGLRYDVRIITPNNGKLEISDIEIMGPGKFNGIKQDFYFDNLLFFKDKKVLETILKQAG